MTAPQRQTHTVDRALAFKARCEARALLYYADEIELIDAVDSLQLSAVESGLVRAIGQDAVQAMIAAAFARVRR